MVCVCVCVCVCVRALCLERYAGLGTIRITKYTVSLLTQRGGSCR